MSVDLKTYARRGAEVRLIELEREMQAILTAFPDLQRSGRQHRARSAAVADGDGAAGTRKRRRRKPMTPSQKRAVSIRMKKYWAARRQRHGKGSKPAT